MDWNAVKVFLAVVETGSLAPAAQRIGVSHATAFRRLTALEQNLDARLFDRVKGRYVLTDAGAEMLDISRAVARSFEEIDRRVAGRDTDIGGVVRLTAPRSFSDLVLPRYLKAFAEAQPDITVELLVSNQTLDLSDRSADIALRVAEAPPEHLWGRRLLTIDWAIYASPTYLSASPVLAHTDDLSEHALIGPAGVLAKRPAFERLLKDGQDWTSLRCDDLTTMASLAAAGHGPALLPDDMRRPDLERCFVYASAPPNTLWALTHPDLRKVKRISLLLGFLAKSFVNDPLWNGREERTTA